jgi:hypothetical protein
MCNLPGSACIVLSSLGLSLSFLSDLGAQTIPESPMQYDEIVVTGAKERDQATIDRATNYVRSLGVAKGDRAIARWIEPICPKVLGISVEHAELVEARFLKTAQRAEVPIAIGNCKPNIIISFAANASAIVKKMQAKKASTFREVPVGNRGALLDDNAPVRWWYSTEVRSSDGNSLVEMQPPGVQMDGGGALPTGSNGQTLSLYNSSIISTQTARALRSATIIIDVNLVNRATLDAVADYAALVGLAEIDFVTNVGSRSIYESIMSLFYENSTVLELTKWDEKFLHELYSIPLDRAARYQRGRLIAAVAEN